MPPSFPACTPFPCISPARSPLTHTPIPFTRAPLPPCIPFIRAPLSRAPSPTCNSVPRHASPRINPSSRPCDPHRLATTRDSTTLSSSRTRRQLLPSSLPSFSLFLQRATTTTQYPLPLSFSRERQLLTTLFFSHTTTTTPYPLSLSSSSARRQLLNILFLSLFPASDNY